METTGDVKVDIDAKMIFNHTSVHPLSGRNKVCINFLHILKRFEIDESEGTVTSTGFYPAPPLPVPQIRLDLPSYEFSPDHLFTLIDSRLSDPPLSHRIALTMADQGMQNVRFLLQPYLMTVNVVFTEDVIFTVPVSEEETREEEEEESTCVICLEDSLKSEMLELPPCLHRFHPECIGEWLLSHNSCPLCREIVFYDETDSD